MSKETVVDLSERRAVKWMEVHVEVRRDLRTSMDHYDVRAEPLEGFWDRAREHAGLLRMEAVRVLLASVEQVFRSMESSREREFARSRIARLMASCAGGTVEDGED